jgi:hypothetical protein
MKHYRSKKPFTSGRFDWEALWIVWGIGIVCSGISMLIIWATMTDPEGSSNSTGYTLAQRLARTLPDSMQEKLAFVFAALILLFGVICVLLGFKTIIQFLFRNWKDRNSV